MCCFPAGSKFWTNSLFLNSDLFLKTFRQQPVISGGLQFHGFPLTWDIYHEVSLLLEEKWRHDCDPIQEQTDYFLSSCINCWCFAPGLQDSISLFLLLECIYSSFVHRVQSAQSDVQREGLDQTVLRSAFVTTGANVTLKLDSASVPKVSLATGVHLQKCRFCVCLFCPLMCMRWICAVSGIVNDSNSIHRKRRVKTEISPPGKECNWIRSQKKPGYMFQQWCPLI